MDTRALGGADVGPHGVRGGVGRGECFGLGGGLGDCVAALLLHNAGAGQRVEVGVGECGRVHEAP